MVLGTILMVVGVGLWSYTAQYFFIAYQPYATVGLVVGIAGLAVLVIGIVLYSTSRGTHSPMLAPYFLPPGSPYVPPAYSSETARGESLTALPTIPSQTQGVGPTTLGASDEPESAGDVASEDSSDASAAPTSRSPQTPRLNRAMSTRARFWLRIAVLAVVVVIALVVVLDAVVLPFLAQPKMTLTDVSYLNNRGSCASFSPTPPQSFMFTFTVHNTGAADGFATVSFIVLEDATGRPFPSPGPFAQNRYFVPAHTGVGKDATVQVNDCYSSHTWDVVISAVDKA